MTTTLARILLLSRTSAALNGSDPILLDGELAIADSGSTFPIVKIGDGVRHWSTLPILNGGSSAAPPQFAVQYNVGGVPHGSAAFTFDGTTATINCASAQNALVINGPTAPASYDPIVSINQTAIIPGGSANVGLQFDAEMKGAAVSQPFITVRNDASGGDFVFQRAATNFSGTLVTSGPSGPAISMIASGVGEAYILGAGGRTTIYMPAAGGAIIPAPPATKVALTVAGAANQPVAILNAPTTTGQSLGLQVNAGTNSSDWALNVNTQTGHPLLGCYGDGSFFIGFNGANPTLRGSAAGGVSVAVPAAATTTLALATSSGSTALAISGPTVAPTTFAPLELITQTVGASSNGAPQIALMLKSTIAGAAIMTPAIDIQNDNSSGDFLVWRTASAFTGAVITGAPAGPATALVTQGAGESLVFGTNGKAAMWITAAGNVTFAAQSSGAGLTLSGVAPFTGLAVNSTGPGRLDALVANNTNGASGDNVRWELIAGTTDFSGYAVPSLNSVAIVTGGPTGPQGVIRTSTNCPIVFGTLGIFRGQVDGSGSWTLAAPTAGSGPVLATKASALNSSIIQGVDSTGVNTVALQSSAAVGYVGSISNTAFALFTNNANRITISNTGAVAIVAPTSGVALTVAGVAGASNTLSLDLTAGVAGLVFTVANTTATSLFSYGNVAATVFGGMNVTAAGTLQLGPGNANAFNLVTNNAARISIDPNGAVSIFAPAAGSTLSIVTLANQRGISITTTAASGSASISMDNQSGSFIQFGGNGSVFGWVGSSAQIAGGALLDMAVSTNTTSNGLILATAATARLIISGTGDCRFAGALAMNNKTAYGGSAGWGTPTGGGVLANFPGASATLVQCSNTISTLIQILKNFGLMLA
jgi:hypothetical protein